MPKSKRNKIVHLTQTKKKTVERKREHLPQVQEYLNKCKFVYVFDIANTKSDALMRLRVSLKEDGRVFAGKLSIMRKALEMHGQKLGADLSDLVEKLEGKRALFFTGLAKASLLEKLKLEHAEFLKKLVYDCEFEQCIGAKMATDDGVGNDAAGEQTPKTKAKKKKSKAKIVKPAKGLVMKNKANAANKQSSAMTKAKAKSIAKKVRSKKSKR